MHIGLRPIFVRMPPKKKVEYRGEEESERDSVETDISVSSSGSSMSACSGGSLSSAQLQQILESNQKAMLEASHMSMTALLATLGSIPGSSSTPSGAGRTQLTRIDIPKWVDGESPSDYFGKFEQALTHNGVEKSKWGALLQVYLSGSAQAAFKQLNPDILDDFDKVKAEMLESLGDTPEGVDKRWFGLGRQRGESHRALFRRVHNTGFRRMDGLETKIECCDKMILSKFLTLLTPECYASVVGRRPKTGQEAARFAQEHEEDVSFARTLQPRSSGSHFHSYRREQGSNASSVSSPQLEANPTVVKDGTGVVNNSSTGNQANNDNSNGTNQLNIEKQEKFFRRERKPIVCYSCGEPGHIKPNCPYKIRRVGSSDSKAPVEVEGWLGGVAVKGLRIDTGADKSIIRAEFVPKDAYLDKYVILDSWRGKQFSKHRVARLLVKVGETKVLGEFAVAEKLDSPAYLGNNLGRKMKIQLLSLALDLARNVELQEVTMQEEEKDVKVVRVTRAQEQREELEKEMNDDASAQSESNPLPDIFDFEDSLFEDDPVPTAIESCVAEAVEVPLPTLVNADSDCLAKEQQADVTLKDLCAYASKAERGFSFREGILVHTTSDSLGDELVRIVVPFNRRLGVLELGHSHMLAGHYGFKKTYGRISARFLWPKMWLEIMKYVRTCAGCQEASREDQARAPLQPLQCEGEPFTKVAFDLVGPLPRSLSGYKYVVTMMDLYTQYPAAVSLKSELVVGKEVRAKAKMKAVYYRKANSQNLGPGDMVLVWKPGVHAKMGSSWDDPFQIEDKVSPVTFRMQEEDEEEMEESSRLKLAREDFVPSEQQQAALDRVLALYPDVLHPDPGKIDLVCPAELKAGAVRNFSQPLTKRQVRQSLGLMGYYRKFVKNYAEFSFNLTEATKKAAPERVVWSSALQKVFVYLKDILCSLPCLTLPVVGGMFLLQTDASGVGLGAVLSVIRKEEELQLESLPPVFRQPEGGGGGGGDVRSSPLGVAGSPNMELQETAPQTAGSRTDIHQTV